MKLGSHDKISSNFVTTKPPPDKRRNWIFADEITVPSLFSGFDVSRVPTGREREGVDVSRVPIGRERLGSLPLR